MKKIFYTIDGIPIDIIAWKEIIPPKDIKENENKMIKLSMSEEENPCFEAFTLMCKKASDLEAQIEKLKQDLNNAKENANRQDQWDVYSVLSNLYNDNFEITKGVSN